MKYFKLSIVSLMTLQIQIAIAQSNSSRIDTTARYYSRLVNSSNPSDKSRLETMLYDLLKSNNERDWLTAQRFFYQLKKNAVADSIAKADKIKFPLGQVVRNEEVNLIYNEKDPVKKEAAYKAWMEKFPPEKFGPERIQYDYARNSVADAYAEANNVDKAIQYANMTETEAWKGEGWGGPATKLLKNGHLKEAAELFKKARDIAYKFMTTNRNDPGAGFAATGFVGYNNSLAEIFYKQKNYSEALKYIKEAHDSSKAVRANVNSNYANILMALGRNQEAFDIINESVVAGQASAEMKENLKKLYTKIKGSDAGYDDYIASHNKALVEKIRKDIAKQIINNPAPTFALRDVDGNTVSLQDLKGKTVVLDFWATWCGPCKRSFPAMKMAVEKFKKDPDVKFFFIHTWEKEEHATDSAKSFIARNNYPFQVLMDLKNKEGLNEAAESYKISGVPTKFVIDKNGNIRFRFTGFEGSNELAVEEITAMIELADKEK